MRIHPARGNVLIFVLMLIAIIMLIIYAGTTLQPLEAKALDQHLHTLTLQAALDSATEEALANLDAGHSPEFLKDVMLDGQTVHLAVRQLRAHADEAELQLSSQLAASESETRTILVTAGRHHATWHVTGTQPSGR